MAQQTSQVFVCTTRHLGTHTVEILKLQLTCLLQGLWPGVCIDGVEVSWGVLLEHGLLAQPM